LANQSFDGWVCAACSDGGDVIRLVEKALGLDFKGAVEWLGGIRQIDPQATRCAVYRAIERLRHLRADCVVKVAWAAPGRDFNDMMSAGSVAGSA